MRATDSDHRRCHLVEIDANALVSMFNGRWFRLNRSKLPNDAEILAVFYEPQSNVFTLKVWSNDFEPTAVGASYPMDDPGLRIEQREDLSQTVNCGHDGGRYYTHAIIARDGNTHYVRLCPPCLRGLVGEALTSDTISYFNRS